MSLGLNKVEAVDVPAPKYVDEKGQEKEYDLSVVPSNDRLYFLENTTNTIKTYFKKSISDFSPIKVVVNDEYFEWTPFGVGFRDELENEQWLGRIGAVEATVENGNKVIYKNFVNGIDDEFIVDYGKLKHNTILNSVPVYDNSLAGREISFAVDGMMNFSTNVSMYVEGQLQSDNFETQESIVFKNQKGDEVYSLPTPIAYEVNGFEQINCKYIVTREGSIITLKIIVPLSWLEDASRVYPIAIDPTIVNIIISGVAPTNIFGIDISPSGNYVGMISHTDGLAKLYGFNKTLNTLSPIASPAKRAVNNAIAFSPDERFLAIGSYSAPTGLKIYEFDNTTQSFTKLVYEDASAQVWTVAFSSDGTMITYGHYYNQYIAKFDKTNGNIYDKKITSTPYIVTKTSFTENGKYILRIENDARFRMFSVANGTIGTEVSYPSLVQAKDVFDYDISSDNRFITFALYNPPYFCVCPFNQENGVIGTPITPSIAAETSVGKIAFSKEMQYIAIYYRYQIGLKRVVFYKFDKFTGAIGEKINLDDSLPQPNPSINNAPYSLKFSKDGDYLLLSQGGGANNTFFMYKFFYEPSNNVHFKDEATGEYYTDNKGNTLVLLDFGTIIASQTTPVKKVLIENRFDFAVKDVILVNRNSNPDFTVEISKTDNPFTPEVALDYGSLVLNPTESVPFYVRIVSTDKSMAGGMFEFVAKVNAV
ncbi:WD40 repeat domain-containing protein [Paenibacillus lautus]|uniref:WD40 repeat domain-containing protein n=1 Tax=Paenibacillus lautus TaxID=1401 RepID=UPI003D282ECF